MTTDIPKNYRDQIDKLVEIGISLSSERNIEHLLERIVFIACELSHADGGTLYLLQNDQLLFKIIQNKSLEIFQGGKNQPPVNIPPLTLDKSNVSAYAAIIGETVNIPDVYNSDKFDFSGPKKFDIAKGYLSKSMLVVPMKNHKGVVTGVLQLINSINIYGEVIPFPEDIIELIEAVTSQAAVAFENARLLSETKALFDSIIKVMAVAIDAKSHYTGNHVQRVALLNIEIAEAINNDLTVFTDVKFNESEMEEIRLAGWLHDIGKVTTPVNIMDKATKLQSIYDRIELVRERFDNIKMLSENKKLEIKNCPCNCKENGNLDSDKVYSTVELDQDFEIVRRANMPNEFLDDSLLAELKKIADKKYFIDGEERRFLTEEEFANLSIRKGSLTEDEMSTMRDHVKWTRKMLDTLPFPEHLKNVSLYASQHHEKLNGKGYPDGLTAERIPLQSRILAIADFYEALSANDRPYKKKMPYEKVVEIMRTSAKYNEIDGKVLEFIVKNSVFERFEEKYMSGFFN